jgi:TatD DNase family protein
MFIDIHRHRADKGKANLVLRNLFHSETDIVSTEAYCSVGLHPWHIKAENLNSDLNLVEVAVQNKNVFAIGETGIDKAKDIDLELQRKAFMHQIEIAKSVNKPLIIHCVKAYDELLSDRKNSQHNQPWIFHWFNAAPQTAFDLIGKGCYLSFGIMLFKEESKALKAFQQIPIESVFFETDDVDISITEVYEKAARLKNISIETLQNQIEHNFKTCFGIQL